MTKAKPYIQYEIENGVLKGIDTDMPAVKISKKIKTIHYTDWSGVKSVILPKNVKTVMHSSFSAAGVESVRLPAGIGTIEDDVFQECTSLKSVSMPGATKIKFRAFENCENLKNINSAELEYVGRNALDNCKSLTKIKLAPRFTAEMGAFSGCKNLKRAVIRGKEYKIIHSYFEYYDLMPAYILLSSGRRWRDGVDGAEVMRCKSIYNFDIDSEDCVFISPDDYLPPANEEGWYHVADSQKELANILDDIEFVRSMKEKRRQYESMNDDELHDREKLKEIYRMRNDITYEYFPFLENIYPSWEFLTYKNMMCSRSEEKADCRKCLNKTPVSFAGCRLEEKNEVRPETKSHSLDAWWNDACLTKKKAKPAKPVPEQACDYMPRHVAESLIIRAALYGCFEY